MIKTNLSPINVVKLLLYVTALLFSQVGTAQVHPFTAAAFAPKVDLPSGSGPYSVILHDLDGDGKPDIVAVNSGSQTVCFFKNNSRPGSAVFTQAVVKTTDANSLGVAFGDLDGDGKPDVVVTDFNGSSLLIYKNTSTPGVLNFADATTVPTDPSPYDVVIADFNGDGKPDLAITYNNTFPGKAAVFINQTIPGSAIAFSPPIILTTQSYPRGITAADLDGDGKTDLVVTCQGGALSVFRNISNAGNAVFAGALTLSMPAGSSPESTVIADLDGDLKPDLAVANNNPTGTIAVLKNASSPGAISFFPLQEFSAGAYPFSITAADVNGDGKQDIAVTEQLNNTVMVLINSSSGGQIGLNPGINLPTGMQPRCVVAGDIDGDGNPDLVVGNAADNNVSLLLEEPPPTIQTGPVSGSILACTGSASAAPNLEQFAVTGVGLTGNITAVAPAGFELSLTPLSGFESNVSIGLTGGTIFVRSSATANNLILGNVSLSSPGASIVQVAVNGKVNAPSSVNQVQPQTVTSGSQTTPVNFTGNANGFTWVNDTPGIGLAASGSGDIPSFTAINNSKLPVTAKITVTPSTQGYAIIGNEGSNNVSVISTLSHTVIATIPVGVAPWGVAVSGDGKYAYVANTASTPTVVANNGSLSVIDIAKSSVIANIPLDETPYGVVISPDGSKVFVTDLNSREVEVINTTTNAVEHIIYLSSVQGLALSPDGKWLYVSGDEQVTHLYKISTDTYNTVASPLILSSSAGLVVSNDGQHIYMTNGQAGTVVVLNTSTFVTEATINTGGMPYGITMLPDGSKIYVSNWDQNYVSVIRTANNTLLPPITLHSYSYGIAATPDGSEIYVAGENPDIVSVINTMTNQVANTVQAGVAPISLGNFVTSSTSCISIPSTFTITVNPEAYPTITTGAITGTISACEGTPSTNANIQQVTVSGNNLSGDIMVTAPKGFEVSQNMNGTYSNVLTYTPNGGVVTTKILYIRSGTAAPAGIISNENVTLSSQGATDQLIPLSGMIYSLPSVNLPFAQTWTNGTLTAPFNFTGSASGYSWINNNTSIGLAATGTGSIPTFVATNNTNAPVIATVTVTPINGLNCEGQSQDFDIIVEPSPTILNVSGELNALTTVYGTPSLSEQFSVSCNTIGSIILITPPAGFEVSNDGTTFSSSVKVVSTANNTPFTVYIRLASSTPVGDDYNGNVTISTSTASGVQIDLPVSTVTPALLTIMADDKSRPYDTPNPALTFIYNGFVNDDKPSQLTAQPVISTSATILSVAGRYPITVQGAASPDYIFNYIEGTLTITPFFSLKDVPNTFTPNGDNINDTWDINALSFYPGCKVDIFNRYGSLLFHSVGYNKPWDGTYHNSPIPDGTYYFIIDLNNGESPLAGFVTVIR